MSRIIKIHRKMLFSRNSPSQHPDGEPINFRIHSFDIFGTLLCRFQTRPQERFRSAYAQLTLRAGELDRLVQLREQGEARAADRQGPDLYTLEDIYDEVLAMDARFRALKSEAMAAELEMERKQCFAISRGRHLWQAAQKKGRVIYVSDMYLPAAFLQELLERNGLWAAGARLFVSHAEGCAKHSGLFFRICKELNIQPSQLSHTGDNSRADWEGPRQAGVQAHLFLRARDNRYEAKLRQAGFSGVADAARAGRLRGTALEGSCEETLWDTAASVAAPLFLGYVIWLRERARALGLKKLFFISRDGLIFKEIYDQIQELDDASPLSHYLYGSRQAWMCARLARLLPEDLAFLVLANPTVSLSQLARRCDLEAAELPPPPWDPHRSQPDKPLKPKQIAWIQDQLRGGTWREVVQRRARQRLEEVRSYFRQEKVGTESYGLVDLGWFGNLQEYVGWILPENPPKHGFYLELRLFPKIQKEKKGSAFLASPGVVGLDRTTAITLLEILATAPHGSCRGYQQAGRTWAPDLDEGGGFFGDFFKIKIQHEAVLMVVRAFRETASDPPQFFLESWREVAQQNFIDLLQTPTQGEAEALGAARFVSRQEGGVGVEFGPPCQLSTAWEFFLHGFRTREAAWPQAMARRSRGISRTLLRLRHGIGQGKARIWSAFTIFSKSPCTP